MVNNSYDYWNLVNNILPQLKDEILSHDSCISIRGDSGDPVEVVTQTVFRLCHAESWLFLRAVSRNH